MLKMMQQDYDGNYVDLFVYELNVTFVNNTAQIFGNNFCSIPNKMKLSKLNISQNDTYKIDQYPINLTNLQSGDSINFLVNLIDDRLIKEEIFSIK